MSLYGSARVRYESLGGQYRPDRSPNDQLLATRLTLGGELRLGQVSVVGEVVDARAWGADEGSGIAGADVNTVDVPVMHVRVTGQDWFGIPSENELRLGRFYISSGSGRLTPLVASPNGGAMAYANAPTAFTGVSLTSKVGRSVFSAFYTAPLLRLPADQASYLDNDHGWDQEADDRRFWGLTHSRTETAGFSVVETYLYGLSESDPVESPSGQRNLWTVGGRAARAPEPGRMDGELEAAWQGGEIRNTTTAGALSDLDVEAWFIHAELGYTADAAWRPRVALILDAASGDKDPDDEAHNRFDSLYGPRSSDFGPSGIYGPLTRSNIVSLGVRVQVQPTDRLESYVYLRPLWLQSETDSFARTGVRDSDGASGRFAGYQLEARARYWLQPGTLRLQLNGAALFDERFLRDAPNASGFGTTVYGAVHIVRTF